LDEQGDAVDVVDVVDELLASLMIKRGTAVTDYVIHGVLIGLMVRTTATTTATTTTIMLRTTAVATKTTDDNGSRQ
jgi:hypothetical protein